MLLVSTLALVLLAPMATKAQGTIKLNGAGSTFDNPLFSKAFKEYAKLHPNVHVNYQSVGSGAGIQQLTNQTVDFGASDAPMTADQLQAVGGADAVVHLPITLGAVAIAYNLPGLQSGLKLTGPIVAEIYLGTITKWNDAKIAAINPGLKLPSTDIAVVHRSDGSGTTDILSTYLSSVSPEWKQKVGSGVSLQWPVGIGGKGSEGVAGQVQQIEGGIGYFELAYATPNKLTVAEIQNAAGAFVAPSSAGASACAADAAPTMPADLRIRIAGACTKSATAYPISGFSWVILYKNQTDPTKGKALVEVLDWLIHDGQQYAEPLSYAPLPAAVAELDVAKLKTITAKGRQLMGMLTPAMTIDS